MIPDEIKLDLLLAIDRAQAEAGLPPLDNLTSDMLDRSDSDYETLRKILENDLLSDLTNAEAASLFRKSLRGLKPTGACLILPLLMRHVVRDGDLETADSLLLFLSRPGASDAEHRLFVSICPQSLNLAIRAFLRFLAEADLDLEADWISSANNLWNRT